MRSLFHAFLITLTILLTSLSSSLLLFSYAAPSADLITTLPGYGATPTPHYSGFLSADNNNNIFLHYYFVEAVNNSATAPVVLWLNGGPGCSSLEGLWNENGPLTFTGELDSNGIPIITTNPGSWNQVANVLYLEAPAGVGFSYAADGNTTTDDWLTAQRNYNALISFFAAFPEYVSNSFYISGESYAGIYVPTLAYTIATMQSPKIKINLKGFLVGNGCIGNSVGSCSPQGTEISAKFLFGHGLYSEVTHTALFGNCTDFANPSDACQALLDQMSNEVGGVNIYNIYAPCINDDSVGQADVRVRAPNPFQVQRARTGVPSVPGPVECIDCGMMCTFLNRDDVRSALHVQPIAKVNSWAVCTSIDYSSTVVSLLDHVYPTLIAQMPILIYSGDTDACVPHVGTEEWTSSLGLPVVASWHPWLVDDQVAGYATQYASNFTFVTVKGAGHMVPQYQPAAALAMLTRYLNQESL